MRERSGRSGRRRGSQKLGTASGSLAGTDALARGDCGDGGARSGVGCACATDANRASIVMPAIANRFKRVMRDPAKFAAEHSTGFRAGQTYYRLCSGEMLLDLVDRHPDEILVYLGPHCLL
jgi:hypothetical protein